MMHKQGHPRFGAWHGPAAVLVALTLASVPPSAHAAAVTPGAGNLLQQTQPTPAPKPSHTHTGLHIERQQPGVSASKVKFAVKRIAITGNTLFSTSTLHGLVSSGEGKELTLGLLEQLAGKITDYYHAHGYSLTRAVIPAQTVKGGVIHFEVIEAHYGKINLNNRSRVRDRLLSQTLAPLRSGAVIGDASLNRALLLLSDIPGMSSGASLSPGTTVGTSNLNIDAQPAPRVTGNISADNYGNQYTGRGRVGASVTINDPLHLGDVLNLNLMTAGKGLAYGRAAYDVVVNGYGTSVGASYSSMHYILGGSLSNLHGFGTAKVASAWVKQPLIRSLTLNLYAQAQLNNKRLRDHIDATGLRTDRHLNDGALSLSGDVRDHVLGTAAVTSWDISWSSGHLSFDDPSAAAADAATAKTAGQFEKWNMTLIRLQQIDMRNSLYLSVTGQWSNRNLDSVEKTVVGGPYGLRGYDMGVLSADDGYLGTVEYRHRFTGRLQGRAFIDGQHVSVNHRTWSAGANAYTLGDAGIGLDLDAPHRWHVGGYLARPVGVVPTGLGKRTDMRGWVQLSKAF